MTTPQPSPQQPSPQQPVLTPSPAPHGSPHAITDRDSKRLRECVR